MFTGLLFDLSPLRKPSKSYYNMSSGKYDYLINVCGAVEAAKCPKTAGACQVEQRQVHPACVLFPFVTILKSVMNHETSLNVSLQWAELLESRRV